MGVGHHCKSTQAIRRRHYLQVFPLQCQLHHLAYRETIIDHQHERVIHRSLPSKATQAGRANYALENVVLFHISTDLHTVEWSEHTALSTAWDISQTHHETRHT